MFFCAAIANHKVTGQAPFSVDFVVRARPEQTQERSSAASGEASPPLIPSGVVVSDWLATGSRSFSDRFRETFSLEDKGFLHEDVAAAKAALANMLGGLGYFTGRTEVKGAGRNGRNEYSFEARLFTGVPSRSFFPRGFLWDEGFHQVRMPRLMSIWVSCVSCVSCVGCGGCVCCVNCGGCVGCVYELCELCERCELCV